MKYLRTTKGFSLIEIIIYVALFSVLAGVVINSFVVVVGSFSETKTNRDLQESGATTMERISREIRQAKAIVVGNSSLSTTPGAIELSVTDSLGTSHIVKFIMENNAINMYQDGTFSANLLGQNIIPTSLIFRYITTNTGSAIKVEMVIQDNRGKGHRAVNFYDTIILRGDY
jgi:prepilin-type N-terminal cleavage/methylation domain-containing protein